MADLRFLFFEHFQLDIVNECVWYGKQAIQLTPKAFALLRYLVERPRQLVTKEELLTAVWPEVIVGEGVLTTHIGVIRQALGDKAKAPRYIETVHRRGFRFIAPVVASARDLHLVAVLLVNHCHQVLEFFGVQILQYDAGSCGGMARAPGSYFQVEQREDLILA